MFASLIVPVDESRRSRRALEVAAALARRTGVPLDLFAVTSPGLDTMDDRELLDDIAGLVDVPVGVKEVVESDSVVGVIAEQQRRHPDSLVVLGTHAHTGVPELFLGGYAGEVLRCATSPVLLVGPHAEVPDRYDALVVCVDGSDESVAVLPTATAFAARVGARLHLVEVLPPSSGADAAHEGNTLQGIAARLDVPVDWEVLHGRDVAAAVVDNATTVGACAIAMATHGRGSALGRLLGSVAMRVAHDARVPVLVDRAR